MPRPPRRNIQHPSDNSDAPLTTKQKAVVRATKWVADNRDRRRVYIKEWMANNRDKNNQYQRAYKLRLKQLAISTYSATNSCACCNESQIQFLTIDHLDNNGSQHRKALKLRGGHQFYQWLKNQGYPPGYQVLCFNCNSARGAYGYCHTPLKPL